MWPVWNGSDSDPNWGKFLDPETNLMYITQQYWPVGVNNPQVRVPSSLEVSSPAGLLPLVLEHSHEAGRHQEHNCPEPHEPCAQEEKSELTGGQIPGKLILNAKSMYKFYLKN